MKKVFMSIALFLLTVVSLSVVPLKAETPIGTSFNFSIETKIGNNDPVVTDLGLKAYGSSVTIDAGSYNTGNEFVTYIVNGKVEAGLPANNAFLVTSDLEITAVYKPTGTVAVAFMDTNQDLLGASFVTSGGEVSAPDISGLSKPGLVVSATTPWSEAFNNPTEDKVVWVVYETSGTETYSLTVNNGTGSGTYDYNEVATVSYNGTGTFQYWFMDGNIVSLQPTYSFTVVDNKEITAVYTGESTGPTTESLFIALSDPYAIKTSYSTYIGQFYLPTGHEMVEFGLIASDTPGDITLATSGVEKIRSDKFNPDTGEFVRSLLDSTYASKNIRAYMITTDGSTFTETYSFVNENLFISEYGEGSSNNKWIEIYNPNDYAVDLSDYKVVLFSNGSSDQGNTASLSGDLAAKDVYVIYNSSAAAAVSQEGDLSSSVTYFNGDDALALYKEGYILDQFGVIGTDPGSSWTIGEDSTEDHTLVRKSTVTSPSTIWDPNEWDVYDVDNFIFIGTHNPLGGLQPTIEGTLDSTINEGDSFNPLSGVTANDYEDGDLTSQISYTVKDSSDIIIDNPGDFSGLSVGTYTITYQVTDSDLNTTIDSVTLTILEAGVVEPELLFSYNFLNGGDNNNNAYASTGLSTNVSFASDNPGGTTGTTLWYADYANLGLTTATRLGGKLASTEYGSPSANIRTGFNYSNVITQVEILGAATFGTAGNVGNIYLQTSTDGVNWTTVSTQTVSATIIFSDLNIAAGAYIKIVVQLSASGTNSGLAFTGIKVTGLPE